jgi:hypothetical protein
MNWGAWAITVGSAMTLAACSKDSPAPAADPGVTAVVAEEATPLAPTNVNIALADMGGAVEELASNYGAGFTGRRLVDGLPETTWIAETAWPVTFAYPQDAVISFFEREPAWIKAVTIGLPADAASAPKDVEIWTSMTDPYQNFSRVATLTLEAKAGEQTIEFDPVEAKFVKLRVVSGVSPKALEIAEVKIIESDHGGYTPLFVRAPLVQRWKGSPREAAQRGLDWLQHAAPTWTKHQNCIGCHVQGQVLMGQAVALQHKYRVNMRSVAALDEQIRERASYGGWFQDSHSASVFGSMGLAYAADAMGVTTDKGRVKHYPQYSELYESAKRLAERQDKDGSFPLDHLEPPIVQGRFMTTGNALFVLNRAATTTEDARFAPAFERALAWLASNEPETTQDKIFKIIALMHYGTAEHKRSAWSVVETLSVEQQPDGGWKEHDKAAGSNALATGQVLYAFKQAGVSIHTPMFKRGVDYLLRHQDNETTPENGTWQAVNTDSKRPSAFAHTMWAVIGLAGADGAEPTGALQIVKQEGDRPPSRNLDIVHDVSGSMNAQLGDTTRGKTAQTVLEDVVQQLPEDLTVGLRVYGHRHSSKSKETCKDTELVVPIEKLDRARLLKTASKLKPRGETPLIHSILQAVDDLKQAGGGAVILITDGEESCKGDAQAATTRIADSGVNVTLNIVGFTITGETVAAELGTLAGSTGGRYYSAQDGAQLSRAMMLAALNRLPYDIFDSNGKLLVSGQTSELSRELPPGKYRIRIDALGQTLEEQLNIVPDQTTSMSLGVVDDRFVLRR